MRLLNNKELATELEDLKLQGSKQYISHRKKLSPAYNGDHFSIEGKGDVLFMSDYGVGLGFGLNEDVLASDIEKAESFIRSKKTCSHLHFEVTSFSDPTLLNILQERGYTLDHFLAFWVLDLEEWKPCNGLPLKDVTVTIQRVTPDESYEWARTVALGISSDQTATDESIESVKCFLCLPNSTAFLVKEKGESVAGGHLAITGQLGELFLTSTLQSHRGKGYQNLLIEERIHYAKSKGCTHLTVTTKPTTQSARNMEKNGFTLMYNKALLRSPILN